MQGWCEVTTNRSSRGLDRPAVSQALSARQTDWDPIRGLHQGQRPSAPPQQAGHMSAPDRCGIANSPLAPNGPFSNRGAPVKLVIYAIRPGHGSLRGQRELPQHLVRSGGQALQGPQRATLITRPPARRAIACTLALGRCLKEYLTSFDELRCHGRRGPAERLARSPDTVQDDGQLARQGYPCLA